MEDYFILNPKLILFLIILISAVNFIPIVNYYFKFACIQFGIFFIGFLCFPSAVLNMHDPNKTILRSARMGKEYCKLFGLYFEFQGTEKIVYEDTYVIVSNHQSSIDTCTMQQLWPYLRKAAPVVKGELRKTGPLAWTLKLCGTVFVDRTSNKRVVDLNKSGLDAKNSGTSLYIFPEGTRNHKNSRELLPFKKGAFHLAFDSGLPILPVAISSYDFLDRKNYSFKRPSKPIVLKVLDPIPTAGLNKEENMADIIEKTRNVLTETLQKL